MSYWARNGGGGHLCDSVLRAVLVSFYLTQTFWEMILEELSIITMFKKYQSTKIRKNIGPIWNSLKTLIKTPECSRLVATNSLEPPHVSSCLAPKNVNSKLVS